MLKPRLKKGSISPKYSYLGISGIKIVGYSSNELTKYMQIIKAGEEEIVRRAGNAGR